MKPAIPGAELGFTSDEALALDTLPAKIVIVGGGYIALEFAGIFKGLGSDVTLMFRQDLPLRGFDEDLRKTKWPYQREKRNPFGMRVLLCVLSFKRESSGNYGFLFEIQYTNKCDSAKYNLT